jgi:hypothetical protein
MRRFAMLVVPLLVLMGTGPWCACAAEHLLVCDQTARTCAASDCTDAALRGCGPDHSHEHSANCFDTGAGQRLTKSDAPPAHAPVFTGLILPSPPGVAWFATPGLQAASPPPLSQRLPLLI